MKDRQRGGRGEEGGRSSISSSGSGIDSGSVHVS